MLQVGSEALSLAPSFCTNPDELDRIFSVEAWNNLPHDEQRRLMVCQIQLTVQIKQKIVLTFIYLLYK
jgi:hypothetical protein